MDLRTPIHCISAAEPLFLGMLLSGLAAGVVAWWGLTRLSARVTDPWRRRLYLFPTWVIATLMLLLGPSLALRLLYASSHAGAMVCTAFVWPAFLLPPVLPAVLSFARRVRRKGRMRPEQTLDHD